MSYEDVLVRLSDGTATVVGQLWAAVEAGAIPVDDFPRLAADLVALANARGAAAAQAAFRGFLEAQTGLALPIAVAIFPDDAGRLQGAMGTILASDQDTLAQLVRLAANEPLEAATQAYGDAMARSSLVSGWRRGLNSGACQLCRWWHRDGRVFRTEHSMPRHKGCTCHQIPVVEEQTSNYQSADQAVGARETRTQRERRTA